MANLSIPKGHSILIPHTHTTESDGMIKPEMLVDQAAGFARKLNTKIFLAITDHDTIQGVEKAQKRARNYPQLVEIICGEEVSAGIPVYQKHILALNIQRPIPHSKSIEWTINEIKKQNGVVIIPHPHVFGLPIASLTFGEIRQVLGLIDGIEITSNSPVREQKIQTALKQLGNAHVSKIGSSDSHFGSFDLLSAFTIFKGSTKEDLKKTFKKRSLIAAKGSHEFPGYSVWLKQKFLALGVLGMRRYVLRNLR